MAADGRPCGTDGAGERAADRGREHNSGCVFDRFLPFEPRRGNDGGGFDQSDNCEHAEDRNADLEQGIRPWHRPWNADHAAGRTVAS
jgi:hypothetical protein